MPRTTRLDKPLEWYPWNPLRWQSSRRVQRMTWAEKGLYRELMDECYLKGSIPADPEAIADLLGVDLEEIQDLLPAVIRCFDAQQDGRLISPSIEEVRAQQMEGRLARAARRKTTPANPGQPQTVPVGTSQLVPGHTGTTSRGEESREEERRVLEEPKGSSSEPRKRASGRAGAKVALTHLRTQAAQEAFDLIWHDWPKRGDGKYAKGDRLPAEKCFQAILDSKQATAYELVQAAGIYANEHPHCTGGYVRMVATFFNPTEGLWAECVRIHRERGGKAEPALPLMEAMQ